MIKKYLVTTIAAIVLLAGCAQSTESSVNVAIEESALSEQGLGHHQISQEESKLQIEVNGEVLTATLEDNSSSAALLDLIGEDSLTLDMEDYSGFEKVGKLPGVLPTNDEELDTDAGDLILYQGNQFVIYYDQNSWSLTKLGDIDNISKEELQGILGEGNVTVELSVPEDLE